MPKIEECENGLLLFKCPGCDMDHHVYYGSGPGPRWTWNGSADKPTFSPSVLTHFNQWNPRGVPREQQTLQECVCHIFVTDGQIQFLGDCTHKLAGRTVELPDMD